MTASANKKRKPKPYRWGRMMHYPTPFQYQDLYLKPEEADVRQCKILRNWLDRTITYLEGKRK